MRKIAAWAVLSAVLLAGAASGANAALPRYGVFDYGKLCTSKESGDIDGYRIIVIREPEGDYVVFEEAAGALSLPLADVPVIDAHTSKISFQLYSKNPNAEPMRFEGQMSAEALVGTLQWRGGAAGKTDLSLPRANHADMTTGCH